MRCTEEDGTEKGEERVVLKVWINDSADQRPIYDFDAERNLD